ncbi:hypothetical protein AAHA92_06949 [Salvia divinorum]|uniref:DDE Tnp4 domain-containing protein n=1 Tax=Salvia divinorum TaxID=28513 RepID=A0ABD1I9Y6_SALDI
MANQLTQNKVSRRRKELSNFMLVLEEIIRSHQLNMLLIRDSRILRDALSRPLGLKVPRCQYYLCDNGYANSESFITPYKGVRFVRLGLIQHSSEVPYTTILG